MELFKCWLYGKTELHALRRFGIFSLWGVPLKFEWPRNFFFNLLLKFINRYLKFLYTRDRQLPYIFDKIYLYSLSQQLKDKPLSRV